MILAQGFVNATTAQAIYTVPAGERVKVSAVMLFNTNAATQTAPIALKKDQESSSISVRRYVLPQNYAADPVPAKGWDLGGGDSIEASTTTTSALGFVVLGDAA